MSSEKQVMDAVEEDRAPVESLPLNRNKSKRVSFRSIDKCVPIQAQNQEKQFIDAPDEDRTPVGSLRVIDIKRLMAEDTPRKGLLKISSSKQLTDAPEVARTPVGSLRVIGSKKRMAEDTPTERILKMSSEKQLMHAPKEDRTPVESLPLNKNKRKLVEDTPGKDLEISSSKQLTDAPEVTRTPVGSLRVIGSKKRMPEDTPRKGILKMSLEKQIMDAPEVDRTPVESLPSKKNKRKLVKDTPGKDLEISSSKLLTDAPEVARTPVGSSREGLIGKDTPRRPVLKIRKPASVIESGPSTPATSFTTPPPSSHECSRPKKDCLKPRFGDDPIFIPPIDSASEGDNDSGSEDEAIEDFGYLRNTTRNIRDEIILTEEGCQNDLLHEEQIDELRMSGEVEGEAVDTHGNLEREEERAAHERTPEEVEGHAKNREKEGSLNVVLSEEVETNDARGIEGGRMAGVMSDEDMEGESAELDAAPANIAFSWSDDYSTFSGQEETYLRTPGPSVISQDPLELFKAVWDDKIMAHIVEETNRYAWEMIFAYTEKGKSVPDPLNSWTETSIDEMYRYFGMLVLMSLCYRAVLKDYWTTGILEMPNFRKYMPRDRFIILSRLLHFVNNSDTSPRSPYEKRISKIASIIEHCNKKFTELYTPRKFLSLDESLLLWKGRCSWVQYIRTKASRIGIKSYELCEAETGYLLKCLLYAGKNSSTHPNPNHGFENCSAKVVLELMDGFLDAGHTLVMDNWYNQLPLTRFLKQRRTDVIGTLNRHRTHIPDAIRSLTERTLQPGEQIARHCGDISLIAWKDLKLVTVLSTYHKDDRVESTRGGVTIQKPRLITTYNKYMGGVDSKDQKLSMYLMERKRNRKWYMKVFKRLLNTSLLNTYIIYKKVPSASKPLTHRQFREAVAEGLVRTGLLSIAPTLHKHTTKNDQAIRRLQKGDHFVAFFEKPPGKTHRIQKRCVRCTAAGRRSMVTMKCTFCDVPLCAGQCWADYHTLKKIK